MLVSTVLLAHALLGTAPRYCDTMLSTAVACSPYWKAPAQASAPMSPLAQVCSVSTGVTAKPPLPRPVAVTVRCAWAGSAPASNASAPNNSSCLMDNEILCNIMVSLPGLRTGL